MKKIYLLWILLALCASTYAQNSQPFKCDTIINAEGINAQQIYQAFKTSIASSFNSAPDVIKMDDASNCHMIVKGIIPMKVNSMTWASLTGCINFKIEMMAKDGKLRICFSDFSHESYEKRYGNAWNQGTIYTDVRPDISGLNKKPYRKCLEYAFPLIRSSISSILSDFKKNLKSGGSSFGNGW